MSQGVYLESAHQCQSLFSNIFKCQSIQGTEDELEPKEIILSSTIKEVVGQRTRDAG